MQTARTSLIALFVVAAASAQASAQDAQPHQTAECLQTMVGTWNGTATLTQGDQTVTATAQWRCESGAGGLGVRCDGTMAGLPDGQTFEEMDILGYDPGDGLIHWFAVTSTGETHDHAASLDGNTLAAEYTGALNGELLAERIRMTIDGNDMTLASTVTVGAREEGSFSLTARREESAAN